ncbi:hypothetical protein ACF0H5_023167 [Mactra antiquata]
MWMGKGALPGQIPQFGAHKSFTVHLNIQSEKGAIAQQVCGLIDKACCYASHCSEQELEEVQGTQVLGLGTKHLVNLNKLRASLWQKFSTRRGQCSIIDNFSSSSERSKSSDLDLRSEKVNPIGQYSSVLYLDIDSNILWYIV